MNKQLSHILPHIHVNYGDVRATFDHHIETARTNGLHSITFPIYHIKSCDRIIKSLCDEIEKSGCSITLMNSEAIIFPDPLQGSREIMLSTYRIIWEE